MTVRMFNIRPRRALRRSHALQLGVIALFWLGGSALARCTGAPVPGAILGLLAALALLCGGLLSVRSLRRGAHWLLGEMLLFFVPAVVALLDHPEFLGLLGLKVLVVILGSTAAVMLVTAASVDLCLRWRIRHVASAAAVD